MIVATAGHVDHGKTTLVRALTGVDTDRLPEEKRRGMSIDLGFAYLPVPGRLPIAFVDVPGHERFLHNMVAGVQAIDLALLVVAADDGPMPQTHEHLAILRALGVQDIWVVVSKLDRVDDARARAVHDAVQGFSATVFRGQAGLRDALISRARQVEKNPEGLFRMHVDRSFVLDGVGVVVTGTAVRGRVQAGDALTVLPGHKRVRVRSVRANNTEVSSAQAGERAALALHGVSRDEIARGHVLAAGERHPRSQRIDVQFSGSAKRHVLAHFGTATAPARLSVLGDGLARLTFEREIAIWHADRLLLRDPGTKALLGGARVLDALPPARGAAKPGRLALLARLREGSADGALTWILQDGPGVVDLDWLATNFHLDQPPGIEGGRLFGGHLLTSEARWAKLREALVESVNRHHDEFPGEPGRPLSAVRAACTPEYGKPLLDAVLQEALAEGALERWGTHLRLPGHRVALSPAEQALWERVGPLLDADGGKPARVFELAETLGLEPKEVEAFLVRASLAGLAVRVARNRFFAPAAVERMVSLARRLDEESEGAGFAAARFRDRSGLGRNLTIEVLEFLDECGYTKRRGDLRRVNDMEEKRPRWGARTSNPSRGV
jgi:selenocysteine-specific elongation factor